ncbi:MAG: hypothetical protein V1923_02800 [Candidatus Omnitrophota bacterium]
MKKKESLKRNKEVTPDLEGEEFELQPSRLSFMFSGVSGKMFGIVKFILGVCFLPFVYAATVSYLSEFRLVGESFEDYFWSGGITLVLIYFFIWEPAVLYSKGQRLLEFVFNFFKPLVKVAPYVLPVYAIILFALYGLLSLFIKSPWLIRYTLFLLGLAMALHIVYSAKTLRSKKNDFLKGNYIFGFSFIYILDLILLALFMSLLFAEFSFVDFFDRTFLLTKDIFASIFKQLFIPSS